MLAATFRLNAQGKRRDKTQANALAGWRAASHHLQQAEIGRGERIRTSGPCLPKTVLYQAELLPDRIGPQ